MNNHMTNMNHHLITRRSFARKCLGAALPILSLPASSALAQATQVPKSGTFECLPEGGPFSKIFASYIIFDPGEGAVHLSHRRGDITATLVDYGSAVLSGNEVVLSRASISPQSISGAGMAGTVPDCAKTVRLILSPPVKLILADGTTFLMRNTKDDPWFV